MKSWNRIAWIISAFASPVILAQTPGASTPGASSPLTSGGGTAFLQQALQDQLAEIELSKIAENNSTDPLVINFAKAKVRDETQANRMLRELAAKKGIPVSAASDAEHAAMMKILRSKNGTELDDYYAKDMARTDDKLIQLYQSQSADSDRDVASYARSALPQEEQHEKLAQSLADNTARRAT
jgi:putative membrane protein